MRRSVRDLRSHGGSFRGGDKFIRGDCNGDRSVDLADAVCALDRLFGGAGAVDCVAALDTNADAAVDIADPVSLLNFLFAGAPAPVGPYPECGVAAGELSCSSGCR